MATKKPAPQKVTPVKRPQKPVKAVPPPEEELDLPKPPPEEDIVETPIEEPVVEPPQPSEPHDLPTPPEPPAPPPSPLANVDKEKALTFVEEILDTLTFKRVALIGLLVAVGLLIYILYENRTSIVTNLTEKQPQSLVTNADSPPQWTLSANSKASLEALAKSTKIGVVILSDVDLKKNRRIVKFYYVDDPTIKLEPTAQQAMALPLPVFDYDGKNTEQMVSVLSNEYRCDAFRDTVYMRFAPELEPKFPMICRIAVPPFVGQFVGFLTVAIVPGTTDSEIETIRLEVSRVAVEIYMNDVVGKAPVPTKK